MIWIIAAVSLLRQGDVSHERAPQPWAMKFCADLLQAKLIEPPSHCFGPAPKTFSRYEVALVFWAVGTELSSKINIYRDLAVKVSTELPGSPSTSFDLKAANSAFNFISAPAIKSNIELFNKAAKEFQPELKSLGCDPDQLTTTVLAYKRFIANLPQLKPGTALKPFTDVRPDAWYSNSTTNLRKLGLLQGFPDGTFRG